MSKTRNDLLAIFQVGLEAVAGKMVVNKEIKNNNYPKHFHVVAIGKAADAMLQGVPQTRIMSALLISKHGHISTKSQHSPLIRCIESDHPIPKKSTIEAGKKLITFLKELPKDDPCLFLISGGTSALVEVLEEGWDLSELTNLTDYLLANAYPIDKINAVRRQVSKIKGGGLWHYLNERPVSCLMISDVPNDKPEDIGSGLLFPLTILSELPKLPLKYSKKISMHLKAKAPNNFNWKIIASLEQAKQASAKQAEKLGYQVEVISEFLQGDATIAAKKCVKKLQQNPKILFIWGGETTVNLPAKSGRGGRNQHLALAASIKMDGIENTYLLVAGTDGSDGKSPATGALVSGNTLQKAQQLGLNATDYLLNADAYSFFKQTNNLIVTGATGTNVMDLVLGINH